MAETEKNFNIELEELAGKVPEYISERRYSDLKKILVEMNPADIGDLMEELPRENLPLVYRILPKELASEVFVYIDSDTQELLISSFSDSELKEVFDDLYVDDTVVNCEAAARLGLRTCKVEPNTMWDEEIIRMHLD